MKKILSVSALLIMSLLSKGQNFPGYRAGNYTGVNGVFFNPSSIADSRYRFDINLFSANTYVGNNQASFNLKELTKSFNADSLQSNLFGKDAGPASGMINVDVHGPSAMFNVGKKSSMAITTRARAISNVIDLDGQLLSQIEEDVNNDFRFPYTISSENNMRVVVNSWAELGLSYAQVLKDNVLHFVKGGVTVKYLAGAANGFIGIDNFKGTLNEDIAAQDAYLSNTTGRITTGFGGLAVADMEIRDLLKMESTGFGGDIGFTYEYRPDYEKYIDDETGDLMTYRNKYKFKVGVALLDVGKINYKKARNRSGGYNISITGNERFYLSELGDVEIDAYDSFFRTKPQYFTPDATNDAVDYNVSLPTTLHVDVDYHINRGFYVNLAGMVPLAKEESYNNLYYSSFNITPRYEGKNLGLYLPLNYNSLTNFNAGLSLRLGPLFIGSGSVITSLLSNSKQADVHVGLRFGGLQKKGKNKSELDDE